MISSRNLKRFVTPVRRRLEVNIHEICSPDKLRVICRHHWRPIPSVESEDLRPVAEPEDMRPGAESSDGPDGWIAFAACNSPRIDSIRTTWVVPSAPKSDTGQTIYLFSGIETDIEGADPKMLGRHILQPVLQWGGPDNQRGWSVASWFAGRFSELAVRSPFSTVGEGDTLTASITRRDSEDQGKDLAVYDCQFEGIESSKLVVEMPPAHRAVEALEAYDIPENEAPSSYPGDITMQDIDVNGNAQRIRWTVTNRAASYLHLDVSMDSSHNGGTVHMVWKSMQSAA